MKKVGEYVRNWRSRSSKKLHDWMLAQRDLVSNGSVTAKALDYSLKRWVALTHFLDDGLCPSKITKLKTDTAVGAWPRELAVCRAAAQWRAGDCNHEPDPYAYLKEVLTRRPRSEPVRSLIYAAKLGK